TGPGEKPGHQVTPDVPFKIHRLVFAAAMFTDSAICYSYSPPADGNELIGVWDEFWKGEEKVLGWLGKPLGDAVRLASGSPNLLPSERPAGLVTESTGNPTRLMLADVPARGPDLFVSIRASADRRAGEPATIARRMWVGIAPPEGLLVRDDLPQSAQCVRGGEETPLGGDTGAALGRVGSAKLGDQTRNAYRVHPPYRDKVGYVAWWRDATVPEAGKLEFSTGMGEKSPERSDGVWFQVFAAPLEGDGCGPFSKVFEHTQKDFAWTDHVVDLSGWAGKRVRLKFVADCGPHDNATTDQAYWGEAVLSGPGGKEGWTEPVRHMTWVGARPFTSGFYFKDVRSSRVTLQIEIEGSEPLRVESIEVHAAPDAMYRLFERGLVLANPSAHPVTFDLAAIAPGRSFQRLRGTPLQDPVANNGEPIGPTLTLGPQEGLFLSTVSQ
ncbi:MAG: hypothetical protein ACYC6Y_15270, partial [Thermoguttaceae bacterium]